MPTFDFKQIKAHIGRELLIRNANYGNRNPVHELDIPRRLADRLGRVGFVAKGGQTDTKIKRQGYLLLKFKSRAELNNYLELAEEWLNFRYVGSVRRHHLK
jgi:hypothetical protein